MKRETKNPSDSKPIRKKKEEGTIKGIGLFDHIKHVRTVQDPDYFKSLTDLDKKSFNHFMILKALSMNPDILEEVSTLFKYFDKIPSPQFYQLMIGGIIPPDHPKKFYPWVKSKKKPFSDKLIELISTYFEISSKEAIENATLLSSTEKGRLELVEICKNYGLTEKEIESALKGNDKDE